ncbi:hypothetical protein Hanom_Chr10g00903911 [Helianthus anomalus]
MDQVVTLGYIFSCLLVSLIIVYVCVNESSLGCSKKLVHVVTPRWSHFPLTSLQPSTLCHHPFAITITHLHSGYPATSALQVSRSRLFRF